MSKQIGIIILTDTVEDVRGMLNRLEEVFDDIEVTQTEDTVKSTVATETVTVAAVVAPVVPATTTVPGPSIECDINGMPWDARIHTSATEEDGTHKRTGKGVFQKRRGVTAEQIKAVEAEIMATVAGDAAIPSTAADLAQPPAVNTVGIPTIPVVTSDVVLVLPIPADLTTANAQDCINITQVYAQMHGNDAVQAILKAWGMTTIAELPPAHHAAYIDYMVKADVAASQ